MEIYKPYSTWNRSAPRADDITDVIVMLMGLPLGVIAAGIIAVVR